MKKVKWQKTKIFATAFIIFHFLAIPASTSRPKQEQSTYQKIFHPYLLWTRLRQRWPLFVPEPRRFSLKYRAEIYYMNGGKAVWQRPYPPNWSFFPRHLSYNFQKLDLAANNLDMPYVWPDLANYFERTYKVENNPIVKIVFVRSRAERNPPNETGYVQEGNGDDKLVWRDEPLFTYNPITKVMQ